MTVNVESYAFKGGLDLVTPFLEVSKGAAIDAVNYECLPRGGYRRIDGYIGYDGRVDGPLVTHDPVPGTGPVRSVFNLDGVIYAIRDSGLGAAIYRASLTGWQLVTLGKFLRYKMGGDLFSEGDIITGGTSGATATVQRVVYGGGITDSLSAYGLLVFASNTGDFIDGEDILVGAATIAFADGTQQQITLPAGGRYSVVTFNFYGQANQLRAYGASGVGPAFEFDGFVYAPIENGGLTDFPTRCVPHKDHLFLAYPTGSIFSSSIGSPLEFNALTGAVEIAVGDFITDMKSLVGGVLAIGCARKVEMLYGNDSESWQKQKFTDHGIRSDTMRDIGGQTLVLDDRGVQQLSATAAYGDFESIAVSRLITSQVILFLRTQGDSVACISQNKSQYRLFFGSRGFYFTYDGPNLSGVMPVTLNHPVLCVSEGLDLLGRELLLFGTTDGLVMQMDSSNFFNRQPLPSRLQLPFVYNRSATTRKQYRRAAVDCRVEGESAILMGQAQFDSGRTESNPFNGVTAQAGASGYWGSAIWGEFRWASPLNSQAIIDIDGHGESMSLVILNDGTQDTSFTFYGVTLHYSPRRLNR